MATTKPEPHRRLIGGHVLELRVKKEFFDMIRHGQKPEEYRELKEYWAKRLLHGGAWLKPYPNQLPTWLEDPLYQAYTKVHFINGYSATAPDIIVECKGITVGFPNPQYVGSMAATFDATQACFVIQLGAVLFDSQKGITDGK